MDFLNSSVFCKGFILSFWLSSVCVQLKYSVVHAFKIKSCRYAFRNLNHNCWGQEKQTLGHIASCFCLCICGMHHVIYWVFRGMKRKRIGEGTEVHQGIVLPT